MRASLKAIRCMVCKRHTNTHWSHRDSAFPTIPLVKSNPNPNFEIITECFISVALLQPLMGLCIGTSQAWPCVRGIKSHGTCQDWAQKPTSTAFTSRETASSIVKPDETPSASSHMSLLLSLWSQTALVCIAASQTHACSSALFLKEISVTNVFVWPKTYQNTKSQKSKDSKAWRNYKTKSAEQKFGLLGLLATL